MSTVNVPVIEKWVEALESGRYTQTTGYLCAPNDDGSIGYCCLGVLCELAVQDSVIEAKTWDSDESTGAIYAGKVMELPEIVVRWAGLSNPSPDVNTEYDEESSLAELNDGGEDFPTIAALIRANFLENNHA